MRCKILSPQSYFLRERGLNKLNILVATELTEESMSILHSDPNVQVQTIAPSLPAVRDGLKTAHALIARDNVPVDKALLQDAPCLRVLGRVGAGLSGIDVEAATKRGIIVMNTPGANSIA